MRNYQSRNWGLIWNVWLDNEFPKNENGMGSWPDTSKLSDGCGHTLHPGVSRIWV